MRDCDKALETMQTVYKADGIIALGLVDRNWQRYSTVGTGKQRDKTAQNTMDREIGWMEAGVLEAMQKRQLTVMG